MSAVLFFPWFHMIVLSLPCESDPKKFLKLQENSCDFWTWNTMPSALLPQNVLCLFVFFSLKSLWFYVKIAKMCWHNFCSSYPSLPQALESVQLLCKVQGLDSVMELYRQHMGQLLDWLSASVNTWSSYSPQRLQLHIIVIQSGEKWSLNMHKTLPNYTAGAEFSTYRRTIMVKNIQ